MNIRSVLILSVFLLLSGCLGMGSQMPAPVSSFGQSSGAGSAGVHNVVPGDTLYTVSQNYNLPMRDIVQVNHLHAPFQLYVGQRLKLPPPHEYRVQKGDSLYEVSRLFGVNSSEIARLNNIHPPYAIQEGDLLRLPSVTRKSGGMKRVAKAPVAPVEREVLDGPAPQVKISKEQLGKIGYVTPPEKPVGASQAVAGKPSLVGSSSKPKPKPLTLINNVPKRAGSKFLRPVNGNIIMDFGPKKNGLHNDGINIKAKRGTPVKAAENGVVVYAGNALKGSGNLVLLRHQDQWMTAYAHMNDVSVKKGDIIRRGQPIGTVGSTGSVASSQLHFEIRRGTEALNPKNYME